ncbi:DUF2817 domain-containing protein [Kistimonas asteriae]|uniref:DUF2817 domain-containing protein n=1 Tax=Kistimonas asteriae TaxID=517724 RepID=UPI001BABF069|nr:DUF2817 domain-containing protein [Kistimonas asteriae]
MRQVFNRALYGLGIRRPSGENQGSVPTFTSRQVNRIDENRIQEYDTGTYTGNIEKFHEKTEQIKQGNPNVSVNATPIEYDADNGQKLQLHRVEIANKERDKITQCCLYTATIHGTEYFGEAAINRMLQIMHDEPEYIRDDCAYVFYVCLNPWGREHGTRTDHNNVDLNRNTMRPEKFDKRDKEIQANPRSQVLYETIKDILNPAEAQTECWFIFRLIKAFVSHLIRCFFTCQPNIFFSTIAGGQTLSKDFLFYGGNKPAESTTAFIADLDTTLTQLPKLTRLIHTDLHTGLGGWKKGTIELKQKVTGSTSTPDPDSAPLMHTDEAEEEGREDATALAPATEKAVQSDSETDDQRLQQTAAELRTYLPEISIEPMKIQYTIAYGDIVDHVCSLQEQFPQLEDITTQCLEVGSARLRNCLLNLLPLAPSLAALHSLSEANRVRTYSGVSDTEKQATSEYQRTKTNFAPESTAWKCESVRLAEAVFRTNHHRMIQQAEVRPEQQKEQTPLMEGHSLETYGTTATSTS